MSHYHHVPSVVDVGVLTDAVRWIQDKVWVDRLETTIEAHALAVAQVRENCTIPGTSVRTAWLCRDKPSMKEALRAAGVPTAASAAVHTAAEVYQFADAVGYPLILKPRTGAGALDTTRVDSKDELDYALGRFGGQGVASIAVEEFVEGHEGFYDTVCVNGNVSLDFVSHYYLNVLEAMRARWISPQFIATNRVDSVSDYAQIRELGARVNEALGIGTSATHMEWFFGPKGLRFSEIGCRPPESGRGICTQSAMTSTCIANGRMQSCTTISPLVPPAATPPASWHYDRIRTATSPAIPGGRRCRLGPASGSSMHICLRLVPRRSQ